MTNRPFGNLDVTGDPRSRRPTGMVGRTPPSGCPLGQDALVPLFARRIKHSRHRGRPTRASAADQGVRPTICAEWSRVSKLSGIWASACATHGPRRLSNVD
jgi:hypothetical protein